MEERIRRLLAAIGLALATSAAAQTTDKSFNSNGVQIRYVEQGTGEPVLLIHGYTRSIETNWLETGVFQDLAKDHRVIAFDLRGHAAAPPGGIELAPRSESLQLS